MNMNGVLKRRGKSFGGAGGEGRTQQRVELVERNNCGAGVFAATALGAEFVSDFAAGDEDALGVLHLTIRNDGKETRLGELVDAGGRIRMTQHAFRSKHNEGLAPGTTNL